jgi:ADP-heptose:LPS heptosyltransferase
MSLSIPKNILIVRTDRIGDVILSLPIASVIKEYYPNCKVSFLIRDYTKPLTEANPHIDESIIIKENNGRFRILENVRLLKKYNFDAAIVLYPTFILCLIIFLAGIKKRVGTGYRLYSFLFTDRVYEHRKDAKKHELEYNISLLKSIGIDFQPGTDNVKFNLNISDSSLIKIDGLLKVHNIQPDEKFIIIHPGSGGSAVDLPIDSFKKIIEHLSDFDIKIVLTGSSAEKTMCEKLLISNNVINLSGLLTLDLLIAVISKSDLLIANSTGPLHIAAALGKQTFGFYPKIKSCSAQRWGPYADKRFIYEPELDCRDCDKKQCENLNCMNYININNVVNDIKNFLVNKTENKNVH